MLVISSRGHVFSDFPEIADTTGLQNLLQSFRGREMGKGQKSRSMKEHATGVSEGGDRLSVREHGFHAAGFCPSLSGRGSQWPGRASNPQDESLGPFIHLVATKHRISPKSLPHDESNPLFVHLVARKWEIVVFPRKDSERPFNPLVAGTWEKGSKAAEGLLPGSICDICRKKLYLHLRP